MSISKPATPIKPPGLTSDASQSYIKLSKKSTLADHLRVLEENLTAKLQASNELQLAALRADNDKKTIELERIVAENDNLRSLNIKLMERMDELLKIIEVSPQPQSQLDDSIAVPSPSEPDAPVDDPVDTFDPFEAASDQRRILILSDSIFRHVGVDCPVVKPPRFDLLARQRRFSPKKPITRDFMLNNDSVSVKKVVIPGARCDRIILEASLIAKEDAAIYREVMVHVGANYAGSHSPTIAQWEIQDCLIAVQELFPDAAVTYSETLPQYCEGEWSNDDIGALNDGISEFCHNRGMRTFGVDEFYIGHPRHLYARDGLHIGRRGIAAFHAALNDYFAYSLKYSMCMGSTEFWMDGLFL